MVYFKMNFIDLLCTGAHLDNSLSVLNESQFSTQRLIDQALVPQAQEKLFFTSTNLINGNGYGVKRTFIY